MFSFLADVPHRAVFQVTKLFVMGGAGFTLGVVAPTPSQFIHHLEQLQVSPDAPVVPQAFRWIGQLAEIQPLPGPVSVRNPDWVPELEFQPYELGQEPLPPKIAGTNPPVTSPHPSNLVTPWTAPKASDPQVISQDWLDRPDPQSAKGWMKETYADQKTIISWADARRPELSFLDPNSLRLLDQNNQTGMILGELPPSMSAPVLAGQPQRAREFTHEGRKFFYFSRVDSGYQALRFPNQEHGPLKIAPLLIPIESGAITWVDLFDPRKKSLEVYVQKSAPLDPDTKNLQMYLTADSTLRAQTQGEGAAMFSPMITFGTYPVWIDVESKTGTRPGPRYRYALFPDGSERVEAVVFQSPEKLLRRALQHVGSDLDRTGLVLGSLDPKRLDGFKTHFFPHTKTQGVQDYTLTWDGRLSGTDPLEGDKPRFVSVTEKKTTLQTQIINEKSDVRQVFLTPVSPGVIVVVQDFQI